MARKAFNQLVHADWSVDARKRWQAGATRTPAGWRVEYVKLVGGTDRFLSHLLSEGQKSAILAGFDFPIGLPKFYGEKTGCSSFLEFLSRLSEDEWKAFGSVAEMPGDISLHRPFYPARSVKGVRRSDLVTGLAVESFEKLLRLCEQRQPNRRAACPIFWTLGGNQVGKGALSGWAEVVRPAMQCGAQIWPFHGSLESLAHAGGLTIAETYPAEAYGHLGVSFRAGEGKRHQESRKKKVGPIQVWAATHDVSLSESVICQLEEGFGFERDGEDRFDAFLGLLGMIEVVDGRRDEGLFDVDDNWEGWILGQRHFAIASK